MSSLSGCGLNLRYFDWQIWYETEMEEHTFTENDKHPDCGRFGDWTEVPMWGLHWFTISLAPFLSLSDETTPSPERDFPSPLLFSTPSYSLDVSWQLDNTQQPSASFCCQWLLALVLVLMLWSCSVWRHRSPLTLLRAQDRSSKISWGWLFNFRIWEASFERSRNYGLVISREKGI